MAVPAANSVPATMVVPRRYAPARERSVPSLARSIRAGTSTTKGKALSFHTDVTGSSKNQTVRVAAASQPKPTVAALTDDEVRES